MTETSDRVDALCARWDRNDSPGCVVGVVREGRLVHIRAYGMADLERHVPLAPHSVFDIGSTSKQFTAMCILLLAHEGKIALDDDIRRHLPELPEYGRSITIRHLIHHTGGLRDYLDLMVLAGWGLENNYPEAAVLDLVARQREMNFPPGEEHVYSNTGYFLLSLIVQRAAGMSLRAYAQERIFAPLGMTHTHYHDDWTEIVEQRAQGYATGEAGGYRLALSWSQLVGDGGVYTTVEDLARWDQNFDINRLAGGDPGLVDEFLAPGTLDDGTQLNYAGGVMVQPEHGLTMIHHGGAWAGYRAEYLRFPERRLSVICLANLREINASTLARQIAGIYLEAAEGRGRDPAEATTSAGYVGSDPAGLYYSAVTDGIRTITAREGTYALGPGMDRRLEPIGPCRLRVAGSLTDLLLTADVENEALELQEITGGRVAAVYTRVPVAEPEFLESYAGSYYSRELDVTYAVRLGTERLLLCHDGDESEPLRPTIPDGFYTSDGYHLVFARDGAGRASGFSLSTPRVRRLRFARVDADSLDQTIRNGTTDDAG